MLDLVPGNAAGPHQRHQPQTGAEARHQDRRQPFVRATQDETDAERLTLDVLEMPVVLEEHDAVPRRDAQDRDDPDQGAERDDTVAHEIREQGADQRGGKGEEDEGREPPVAEGRLQQEEDHDRHDAAGDEQIRLRRPALLVLSEQVRAVADRELDLREAGLNLADHRAENAAPHVRVHVQASGAVLAADLVWRRRHPPLPHFSQPDRSEEHTSELQSLAYLVCRLLLEKKKKSIRSLWLLY